MDSPLRAQLHDLTLRARELLTTETASLLEGIYGLHRNGRFEAAERLPALTPSSPALLTRRRMERYLADEHQAGLPMPEAVAKLIKEVAFTHLNRLVAFKMLEARRLIRGTIDRYHDSNAFKFYLADPARADDLARYEAGDLPQDALGEGPREAAYRHFLLWQSGQIASEVKVLFDPENLASQLFPRPRALREICEMLNDPEVREAWRPENDETLGWIYQYFNETEKNGVFDRLYKTKTKIQVADVPAATQLFTPRWIVRFLVHNTLGRLWLQMHPDSQIASSLDDLVPFADPSPPISLKPVREISFLDPACGTMHFGLVAFDLFAAMYQEEIDRAGQPGWPKHPSVEQPDDIPAAIVEHNLYGIDIDLRAVQISALTLYLKAESCQPGAEIRSSNLVCSDVLFLNGARLDAFVRESRFTRPIYERLMKALSARLRGAHAVGSLVRADSEITTLVRQERERYEREGRQADLFGVSSRMFESEAASDEFWEIIEVQIVQALDEFARRQAAAGLDQTYFVGEGTKGLRLLNVLLRRYDVVVTNPPYMSRRNMCEAIAKVLDSDYPRAKGDLYTAFIDRCSGLLGPHGRLGMITQQSFMFISSYEDLRQDLLNNHVIETECHVGPHAFEEIGGEKVNTALFVLRREPDPQRRQNAVGTYFRLVREPDAEAKRLGFERALARLRGGESDPAVYHYRQGDFAAIPGAPWVYWITPGIRHLFETLPNLGDIAPPRQGLATADNFRFLRYWWEAGVGRIGLGCADAGQAEVSGKKWFPYMKGGSFQRWYGNQEYCVNWTTDGAEIRYLEGQGRTIASRPQNTNFYFRRGVTYSYLTSGTFSARLSPGGFIFDVAGSSLFPDDVPLALAVLNSTFAAYALKVLNPTVNFQVGDLARLPIPAGSSATLTALVDEAITLARVDSREDERTFEFVAPPSWLTGVADVRARMERLAAVEREIDEEVFRLYGIGAADRQAIAAELNDPRPSNEAEEARESQAETEEEAARAAVGEADLALAWVSYAVGIVLGRFGPGEAEALGSAIVLTDGAAPRHLFSPEVEGALRALAVPDGIASLEVGHPADLVARVEGALSLMLGEAESARVVAVACGDETRTSDPPRRFLERDFFRGHVQRYRKRPIYWLLSSAKRAHGYYVWHERLTRDTLPRLQGSSYLGGTINHLRQRIADQRRLLPGVQGAERRAIEREIEHGEELLAEAEEFARALKAITEQRDERGQIAGWEPELDDGVILNLAPLHPIVPAWSAEPRKFWERLAAGEFDWSFTARRYWPDRTRAKCRANKSYAIAHGRPDWYEGGSL